MNISNLNGVILEDYNKVDSYNNFYNILPDNITRTSSIQCSKVFYTFLMVKTDNKRISFLPNLGKREETLYTIDIISDEDINDEDILDFEFDGNYIYILTNYKIFSKKYVYSELECTLSFSDKDCFNLNNEFYSINNINLDNNGIYLKLLNNFLVFNKYNELIIINLNDINKKKLVYSDDTIDSNKIISYILDFNIYEYNSEIYINYSILNDNNLRIIKLTETLTLESLKSTLIKKPLRLITDPIENNIESIKDFLSKNTLSETETLEFNIDEETSLSSNNIFYLNIFNSVFLNDSIYILVNNCNIYKLNLNDGNNNFELFYKINGRIIDINCNYNSLIINTLNKEVYIIKEDKKTKIIKVIENAVTTYINNVLIMLELKNNRILFYKLNNLPDIYPNYINVEDYSYDNEYGIYLNMNLQLRNYYNTINTDILKLDLKYRNNSINNVIFPEMDINKNVYLKLDHNNILNEPFWYFNTFKPYYKIINDTKKYTISNFGTDTDTKDIISKLFIKDLYYLNGKLYFRIKYIFDGNFFLKISINNKILIVGNIKDNDIDLNTKISKIKEVINNADNYYVEKSLMWKQFEWVYIPIDLELNNINDTLNLKIQIYNRDSNNVFQPIDPDNGGFKIFTEEVRKANYDDILYTTSDGDIKFIEKKYIRMDNLSKETFLDKNFDLVSEYYNDITTFNIDKNMYINNMVNYETNRGNLNLTLKTPVTHKDHFNLSNIYINGKKLYKSNYTQKDLFNGLLETLVPVRNLNQIMTDTDLSSFELNKNSINGKYNVLIEILAKKLIGNEKILSRFKVYSLEEKLEVITNKGIIKPMKSYDLGIPTKLVINEDGNEVIIEEAPYNQYILKVYDTTISNDIEPHNIRLYVKTTGEEFIRRINPNYYTIKLDRDYGFINIISLGTDIFEVGNEIILMTDGISDNLNMFNDLSNSPYDIESIPMLTMNRDTNELFSLPVDTASDIEVIIDGYTLYPEIDYTLINQEGSMENIPPLLVFRRKLKKSSKVELNLLGKNSGHIKYFNSTARDENGNKTNNIITMDDDNMLFIPNKFSVYIDNLRYPNKNIEIINTKTIKIKEVDNIKNIMIRFNIEEHTHLKEIIDDYKYKVNNTLYKNSSIFIDNYYHSNKDKRMDSNFDENCCIQNSNTNSTRKLLLQGKLKPNKTNIINCNDEKSMDYNCFINNEEIITQYINKSIEIDSNKKS